MNDKLGQEPHNDDDTGFSGQELAKKLLSEPKAPETAETGPLPPIDGPNLSRDFQQTFRISNGVGTAQEILMELLAQSYKDAATGDSLEAATQYMDNHLPELRPPKHHLPLDPDLAYVTKTPDGRLLDGSFEGRWAGFREFIEDKTTPPLDRETDQPYYDEFLSLVIERDLDYLTNKTGRPGRGDKGDPRESIVRDYILGDKLNGNGSPHLLKFRDTLRDRLAAPASETPDEHALMPKVKLHWQQHHPGATF